MKSGFDLGSPKYFDKASDLKFDKRLKDALEFESSKTKWIKSMGDQTFLVIFDQAFPVESSTIKNGLFESKNEYVRKKLSSCEGPTLEIGNAIFCFDQKSYHRINDDPEQRGKLYSIEQIFVNTKIDYVNQTLELIFSYSGAFVLMTQTHLFVIDYALANLENNGQSMAISDGPDERLYRLENNMFNRIPANRLLIQPSEKVLFILILILINLLFTGIIFRIIMHRKRLAENRSKEMLNTFNFIHKTISLRDNIRKTLNFKGRFSSRRSNRSSRSRRSKKSKRSGRSKNWAEGNFIRIFSSAAEDPNDFQSVRKDRKKRRKY